MIDERQTEEELLEDFRARGIAQLIPTCGTAGPCPMCEKFDPENCHATLNLGLLDRCSLSCRLATEDQTEDLTHQYELVTPDMIDHLVDEVDIVERHLQILKLVIDNEPIGIVNLANETGYPHHKVRYSLRILEEEDLIEPSSQGAITTDRTMTFVTDLDEKFIDIMETLQKMKIGRITEITE